MAYHRLALDRYAITGIIKLWVMPYGSYAVQKNVGSPVASVMSETVANPLQVPIYTIATVNSLCTAVSTGAGNLLLRRL